MLHSNVICKACGESFTYESRSRKPKSVCSPKCREAIRVYTPEQRAARVDRVRKWREENPELNRAKRRAFYEENRERLIDATRQWYQANTERALERGRRHREANREEINRRAREWYNANADDLNAARRGARELDPETARVAARDRYKRNADVIQARRRERYQSDPQYRRKARESTLAWRKRYPEKARAKGIQDRHIRLARLREVDCEPLDVLEIFDRDNWRCHICDRKVAKHLRHPDPWSASLDHVIPISRGGGHTRDNVRLAHLHCNLAKGDRDM